MTITLTREEAQQLLDAWDAYDQQDLLDKAIEILRARLSAPEPEPMRLRRGDILRCIETNELCTVWATSTTGKTQVKWKANDFGSYTAEQIGDLFWVEPKPECVCGEPYTVGVHRQDGPCYQQTEPEPVAWNIKHNRQPLSSDNPHEVVAVIKREWQGLTDDEIKEIVGPWGSLPVDGYTRKLFDQIEAKLKGKNHG
jgi:hypothetical protein